MSSLNRDFVVAIPGLLGKVLNFACSLPCKKSFFISSCLNNYIVNLFFIFCLVVPRYPLPSTENEQWMAWIDENLSHNNHSFDTVGGFLQGLIFVLSHITNSGSYAFTYRDTFV